MRPRPSPLAASAALALAAAGALVACDPPIDDRPISSLSLDELNATCTARLVEVPDADLRALARVVCVSLDNSAAECRPAALAECTEAFYNDLRANLRCDFAPEVFAQAQSCTVANETLLDCMAGYFGMFGGYADATCENLGDLPEPTLPAACTTLATQCPGLDVDTLEDQTTTRPAAGAP